MHIEEDEDRGTETHISWSKKKIEMLLKVGTKLIHIGERGLLAGDGVWYANNMP